MSVNMTEQSSNNVTNVTEQNSGNATNTNELSSSLLKRIQNYAFGTKHSTTDDLGSISNKNLIHQLRTNIARLEDESLRLDFMMDEVTGLIKKIR